MKVKFIEEREKWNKFVVRSGGSFLQSWAWGNFQHDYGRDVKRIAVEQDGEIIAGAQIISYQLPAKRTYFFSPRGPVVFHDLILEKIREMAPKDNCLFWKLEPMEEDVAEKLNLRKVQDVHPKKTLILDITPEEDELLKNMKPKTRYNIRLAKKKGVKIRVSSEVEALDKFYDLLNATADRQQIRVFPRSYYQLMVHILEEQSLAKVYLAEYEGEVIAANLMLAFGHTMTYLHGGTSQDHRNVMAPQLLQWQAILDAKEAGLKRYDFFGISDEKPSWAGITRFKRGFGGEEVIYPGTFELPLNNMWYEAYRVVKKFKS
ncbi:peptidoglycan bridge formation glycyltransferase FemA/FemB family protein [Patescibacteria group bacterium]|nr:peptidoglycan bridge formation glycyltransferase FemA/FemB family protein [Patescibacteria group bacterium]MBU1673307.1 peptidoglycan bridge formation glycyltransferase FemA/FemB family protein [Patescibacteria group bacterium]MBU1963574.1 peptidoglycan bridge formation glycyltransferase FemA/FemB family protein [Patescibacteria group bacterium]